MALFIDVTVQKMMLPAALALPPLAAGAEAVVAADVKSRYGGQKLFGISEPFGACGCGNSDGCWYKHSNGFRQALQVVLRTAGNNIADKVSKKPAWYFVHQG